MVMVRPAVAVPVLAVVSPAWVLVEIPPATPVEHAFIQLENPSGNVI